MDDASLSKTRWCRLFTHMAMIAVAIVSGCSTYIGTTSKSFLREAKENGDPNIRYVAYAKLGTPSVYENEAQKDEAIQLLTTKLREAKEPVAVRAVIVRSLGNLGDRRARHEIIKAANDVENAVIRVEACRALGKVGRPDDATLLARIMTVDKLEDCRIAAIEGLGLLKANDERIFGILIDGMENDDPAIRLECLRSLRAITGKDLGIDPAAWRRGLEPILKEMSTAASTTVPGAGAQAATPEKAVRPR
jgi:HEAT repeat protein